jgi:hypothetical protein
VAGTLAAMLLVGGCHPLDLLLIVPQEEIFYVVSAEMSSDGKTGLFAFNHVFQRQLLSWPSLARYSIETRGIASYELQSGWIKVVHRSPGNKRGSSYPRFGVGYSIVGVCWDKVLVARDGDESYHWLDVATGALTRSPLPAEAAGRGIDPRHVFILDRRGTIAIWATPPRSPATNPVVRSMGDLWLRRPSRAYEHLGLFLEVHATGDGRILFTSPLI